MRNYKAELKAKLVEKLTENSFSVKTKRIETICRARINRLSYDLIVDDASIYLKRGDKVIFIESNPDAEKRDFYGNILHKIAADEAKGILDKIIDYEAIRNYRSAV